jgi:putative selenate reductase
MPNEMNPQPFEILLDWILAELEASQSVFGIPRSLFYTPEADSPYATHDLFGSYLATPVGPGAGPHTQLAQNIVCAWLSGGRFIELKTVQIMDELEIPRPCIDMEDEGYNVEWSQELKLDQSVDEYVKAWALIHILRRILGFEETTPFGTIFNMSVGYNLEGIKSPSMTRFMDRLEDASEEIQAIQRVLKDRFLQFSDIEIPSCITNSVTLSTMHGCPPDEIERIGRYLLEERGLHTTVKLNPTLLGKAEVIRILRKKLGFQEIDIPDRVFEHDLAYGRAVALIKALRQVAAENDLTFGVKLSNTLAMANHKEYLPGDEMYMSGRALYPITINLFHKLSQEFDGDLNVSYSAGADALNVTTLLACGALPVTTVSDLLKPGGYSRMVQYLERLEEDMQDFGAASLDKLAQDKLDNLEQAAAQALESPRYKKRYHPYGLPKVESALSLFDCITAPCSEQCAVHQDIPDYAWLISQGEYDRALDVILSRNPLPGITGYVCNHLCQTRCTRNNYEEPVAIRALKRFALERGRAELTAATTNGHRVAIIGSGPSGLAAAYFLGLNGVEATIFESRDRPGGMCAIAPTFRLPEAIVQADVDRILALGNKMALPHRVTHSPEEFLGQGFEAVYIASGAQQDARLGIDGEDGAGVFHALDFLERVRLGERIELGSQVLVIGGGNSAMDAARSAKRLCSETGGGSVTIVYRRTRQEMPANEEEIEDALAEGVRLEELVSPSRVVLSNGKVVGLVCVRNELGEVGADGRRRPVPIPDSEFEIKAQTIVIAIGQRPDISFLDRSTVSLGKNKTIVVDPETGLAGETGIYAGGDAVRGPATIIEACADGRRAAEAICEQLGVSFDRPAVRLPTLSEEEIVRVKRTRAQRVGQNKSDMLPPDQRGGFDLVEQTLTEEAALAEAARCVQCASFCDKCVEVCPNRANYTIAVSPVERTLPVLACQENRLVETGAELFRIEQARQIIHVDDLCNECGNCATFCVHNGKPYLDKPRLFLEEADFQQEENNAFYVERNGMGWAIRRREGGQESQLILETEAWVFESEQMKIELSPKFEIQAMALKAPFEGTVSLRGAAEMAVILKGVIASLSFLPL